MRGEGCDKRYENLNGARDLNSVQQSLDVHQILSEHFEQCHVDIALCIIDIHIHKRQMRGIVYPYTHKYKSPDGPQRARKCLKKKIQNSISRTDDF